MKNPRGVKELLDSLAFDDLERTFTQLFYSGHYQYKKLPQKYYKDTMEYEMRKIDANGCRLTRSTSMFNLQR